MELIAIFFILIPIAIAVGILAALIGIGGGVLMVPIIAYIVFEFMVIGTSEIVAEPELIMKYATTISSSVIIFTGLSGTVAFSIQKRVDFVVGSLSAVFAVGGAILGKWMQTLFDNTILSIIFAGLLIVTSIRMFYKVGTHYLQNRNQPAKASEEECEPTSHQEIEKSATLPETPMETTIWARLTRNRTLEDNCNETWNYNAKLYLTPLAFAGGFVAGIGGLGGGIVMVPILHIAIGLPMHFATATSAFIMIFSSISAVGTAALNPDLNLTIIWWPYVAGLAIGIIIGAQIGALVAKRMKSQPLKIIFATALFVVGIWSVIKALYL
ncbi:MAG: sulfite exporter TauE/SafE family protein [Candidatus Heimdallarchaeota archaeon]